MIDIQHKVEKAFQTVLASLVPPEAGLYIGTGAESEEMPLPRIVINCFSVSENPQQSGNADCEVSITIRSASDRQEIGEEPAIEHNALVTLISNIWRDDLAALLNASGVNDLTVANDMACTGTEFQSDGRAFMTVGIFRLYAFGCALT